MNRDVASVSPKAFVGYFQWNQFRNPETERERDEWKWKMQFKFELLIA